MKQSILTSRTRCHHFASAEPAHHEVQTLLVHAWNKGHKKMHMTYVIIMHLISVYAADTAVRMHEYGPVFTRDFNRIHVDTSLVGCTMTIPVCGPIVNDRGYEARLVARVCTFVSSRTGCLDTVLAVNLHHTGCQPKPYGPSTYTVRAVYRFRTDCSIHAYCLAHIPCHWVSYDQIRWVQCIYKYANTHIV